MTYTFRGREKGESIRLRKTAIVSTVCEEIESNDRSCVLGLTISLGSVNRSEVFICVLDKPKEGRAPEGAHGSLEVEVFTIVYRAYTESRGSGNGRICE